MHATSSKPEPLTVVLASTLEALRGVGAEIWAAALARRLGVSRTIAKGRLERLENLGFITSRRITSRGGRPPKVFRVREESENHTMKEHWEYDPATRTLTSLNSIGRRELVANHVKPRDARIVFGLIGVARRMVAHAEPNPLGCKPDCGCLACEARRLLDAIGGEA